jgi:hypothetical protein
MLFDVLIQLLSCVVVPSNVPSITERPDKVFVIFAINAAVLVTFDRR